MNQQTKTKKLSSSVCPVNIRPAPGGKPLTRKETAMHRTAQSQRGVTSFQLLLNSGKLHDPRVKGG